MKSGTEFQYSLVRNSITGQINEVKKELKRSKRKFTEMKKNHLKQLSELKKQIRELKRQMKKQCKNIKIGEKDILVVRKHTEELFNEVLDNMYKLINNCSDNTLQVSVASGYEENDQIYNNIYFTPGYIDLNYLHDLCYSQNMNLIIKYDEYTGIGYMCFTAGNIYQTEEKVYNTMRENFLNMGIIYDKQEYSEPIKRIK